MVLDLAPQPHEHKLLSLHLITECLPVRRLHAAGITRLRKSLQRSGFLENFPLLEISSNRGDTVFDGFAGVGSVGAGAKRLGRKFIGIEQHPAFFEAMQRRLAE